MCAHTRMSPIVASVVLWAPGLAHPYTLLPDENYSFCIDCDSAATFLDKAQDAHAVCRKAGPWASAVVVFEERIAHLEGDVRTITIRRKRPVARA
jgi:hypothetical protein